MNHEFHWHGCSLGRGLREGNRRIGQLLLIGRGQEKTECTVSNLIPEVTVLCQRYLGLPQIIEDDASLPIDELLAYILEKGNFGQKAGLDGNVAAFALSSTEKGGFFKRLQDGGMSRWKAAQKHKIFRPFAWIYQGFRIAGVLVKNRKTPATVLKQSQHGAGQRHLIEALGLEMDMTITACTKLLNRALFPIHSNLSVQLEADHICLIETI